MRTQSNGVELNSNGKFSVKFVTFKGTPGNEYVSSEVESAPVFETEFEAYEGQVRALDYLEQTGRYPNMCEVF
jgi:hypothetical protein